jgi:hypothetical protein
MCSIIPSAEAGTDYLNFGFTQARLEKAQMIVMSDLEDPFVPLSEGLFADPSESK